MSEKQIILPPVSPGRYFVENLTGAIVITQIASGNEVALSEANKGSVQKYLTQIVRDHVELGWVKTDSGIKVQIGDTFMFKLRKQPKNPELNPTPTFLHVYQII